MIGVFEPIAAACDLTIPDRVRLPVAIVGAGGIVDGAHLPAYRRAGVGVRGIFDIDHDRAAAVAARHGLRGAYSSLEELLADDEARVVDVAVVPWNQPAIVRRALDAGRHVLAQKPLAQDVATAAGLVELAASRGLQLVVNQQMRYEEGVAAARAMVERGWVGEVTAVTFDVDIATDWSSWPWLMESERLEVMYHSIHYLDTVRSLLGSPTTVFCTGGRRPGQAARGETRTTTTLLYPGGPRALLSVNHENIAGDQRALLRIDGARGTIRLTLGLLYDYPNGRPDTVELWSEVLPTDGWLPYPVTSRWIPDAFAGPLRALLIAAAGGPEAPSSGADNLGTLAVVEAAYRSMASGCAEAVPA